MNSLGKELSPAVGKGLVGRMVGGGVTAAVTGSGGHQVVQDLEGSSGSLVYNTPEGDAKAPSTAGI